MIPTPRLRHLVPCVMALGLAAFLSSSGLAESDTPNHRRPAAVGSESRPPAVRQRFLSRDSVYDVQTF